MTRWRMPASDGAPGAVEVDTDPARLDVELIHRFLAEAYWARGRTLDEVRVTIAHSAVFGLYRGAAQVGFARVVTDYVTFAYLADVFVLEGERGRGLGTFLVGCAVGWEPLRHVRHFTLFTRDAHDLYRRFGFDAPEDPTRFMLRPGPWTGAAPEPEPGGEGGSP